MTDSMGGQSQWGSGPQVGGFRARLLSQQGQGQSEPWWGCQGRQGMEIWVERFGAAPW